MTSAMKRLERILKVELSARLKQKVQKTSFKNLKSF